MRMGAIKLACFLTLVSMLGGCVSIPKDYPKNWPTLAASGEAACPDISGSYPNVTMIMTSCPEFHHYYTVKRFYYACGMLTDYLDIEEPGNRVVLDNAHSPRHDRLTISVYKRDHLLVSKSLSRRKKDFSCSDDALVLNRRIVVPAEPIGTVGLKREFRRSEDGSLVMRATEKWFVIGGFFLPLTFKQVHWLRWQPFKPGKPDTLP